MIIIINYHMKFKRTSNKIIFKSRMKHQEPKQNNLIKSKTKVYQ